MEGLAVTTPRGPALTVERISAFRAYSPWSVCSGPGLWRHRMPKLLPAALALAMLASPALAQGTPTTAGQMPPASSSAAPAMAGKGDRTAKSKECSAQADQKGLHGKARKRFRSACKAGKA